MDTELTGLGVRAGMDRQHRRQPHPRLPYPQVEACTEWDGPEAGRRVRAELMTLAPGPTIAPEIALRAPARLDEA